MHRYAPDGYGGLPKLCEILGVLRLPEPEPKILGAGSLAHLPLETTLLTQALRIGFREGHAHSGIRRGFMPEAVLPPSKILNSITRFGRKPPRRAKKLAY